MKYTKEKLQEAVDQSTTFADVLRFFGTKPTGGNHTHISRMIKKFGICTNHFKGRAHGKTITPKKPWQEVLVLRQSGRRQGHKMLKRALIESGVEYKCSSCELQKWQDQEITLDIDHINENWLDDRKENLRFLCPNCHRIRHKNDYAKTKRAIVNSCVDCQKKVYKKAIRCKSCEGKRRAQFISKKPSKDQLSKDFKELKTFSAIGRKYGVSDNAVRKWCKSYEML